MFKLMSKWLLIMLLLSVAPVALAERGGRNGCDQKHPPKKCQQVPEGGSTLMYVLGAGMTCLGAVYIRSRASKSSLL